MSLLALLGEGLMGSPRSGLGPPRSCPSPGEHPAATHGHVWGYFGEARELFELSKWFLSGTHKAQSFISCLSWGLTAQPPRPASFVCARSLDVAAPRSGRSAVTHLWWRALSTRLCNEVGKFGAMHLMNFVLRYHTAAAVCTSQCYLEQMFNT